MYECIHRKEDFRLVACPSCNGNVQVKVFQCDKNGECSVSKRVDGIATCNGMRRAVPDKPQNQSRAQPVSRTIGAATDVQSATLTDCIKSDSPIASVRLDDGRTIEAMNERARVGHKQKRCVVGKDGEKWVLLQ